MSDNTKGVHHDRPTAERLEAASADTAVQLADNLWMSPGLSNTYLLIGETGRIIINTGMGFEAPVHRALFDAVDDRPVRAVIITQGHYDHVGGLRHFLEEDGSTQLIAGSEWQTWQEDNDRLATFRADRAAFAFLPRLLAGIEHVSARFPGADTRQGEMRSPTLEVVDRLKLSIDGTEIEVIPVPGGETRDSIAVWLPGQRTVLVGNTFGPLFAHVPNLVTLRGDRYRDPLEYLATVDTIRSLEAEVLITGHWGPIDGAARIRRELTNLYDAMRHVHDRTVEGMNAGTDVHTLMRTIEIPEHLDVGQNYGLTRWNVRAIWENYAGWFHASSTTELYGVPAREVHPDLVRLAGGADAVASAARARLDAREPLEAIHLAEIGLSGEPTNVAALDVLIAAHRALLDGSSNFWEQSWLTRQIDTLTSRAEESAP